jgi:hypothetical protein
MNTITLGDQEASSFEDEDYQEIPPGDIVAYNELRSCADLFRMYSDESLDISPAFQRDIVWKGPAQTRFIDSLIKQLPIPSLCFSYGYKNEEWQVIDGLQRIASIIQFLDADSGWVLSKIPDIDPRLAGVPVSKFHDKNNPELIKLKRRVENATLPITVLRCDPSLESHSNYLFTIFHRLNTGSVKLNNQEIRNCIYSGSFNNLLVELDSDLNWLAINGLDKPFSDRFKRQEIILRFFAFVERYEQYTEGLAKFLNGYMRQYRRIGMDVIELKRAQFGKVVEQINNKLGGVVGNKHVPLAILEALMVGVGRNIEKVSAMTSEEVQARFEQLTINDEFSQVKLVEGLSKTIRVQGRLNAAVNIFS